MRNDGEAEAEAGEERVGAGMGRMRAFCTCSTMRSASGEPWCGELMVVRERMRLSSRGCRWVVRKRESRPPMLCAMRWNGPLYVVRSMDLLVSTVTPSSSPAALPSLLLKVLASRCTSCTCSRSPRSCGVSFCVWRSPTSPTTSLDDAVRPRATCSAFARFSTL